MQCDHVEGLFNKDELLCRFSNLISLYDKRTWAQSVRMEKLMKLNKNTKVICCAENMRDGDKCSKSKRTLKRKASDRSSEADNQSKRRNPLCETQIKVSENEHPNVTSTSTPSSTDSSMTEIPGTPLANSEESNFVDLQSSVDVENNAELMIQRIKRELKNAADGVSAGKVKKLPMSNSNQCANQVLPPTPPDQADTQLKLKNGAQSMHESVATLTLKQLAAQHRLRSMVCVNNDGNAQENLHSSMKYCNYNFSHALPHNPPACYLTQGGYVNHPQMVCNGGFPPYHMHENFGYPQVQIKGTPYENLTEFNPYKTAMVRADLNNSVVFHGRTGGIVGVRPIMNHMNTINAPNAAYTPYPPQFNVHNQIPRLSVDLALSSQQNLQVTNHPNSCGDRFISLQDGGRFPSNQCHQSDVVGCNALSNGFHAGKATPLVSRPFDPIFTRDSAMPVNQKTPFAQRSLDMESCVKFF